MAHDRAITELEEVLGSSFQSELVVSPAGIQIEDADPPEPLETDENPWLPHIIDNDGAPSVRPYVEASRNFDAEPGPEQPRQGPDSVGDLLDHRVRVLGEAHQAGESDLQALHRVDRARRSVRESESKSVFINPVSAYRAVLGGQALLSTAKPNVPIEVARWISAGDFETAPVTVQFLPVLQQPLGVSYPSLKPLRPYGRISFGSRAVYVAEVDLNSGVQLTLNTSQCYLEVGLDAGSPAATASSPDATMQAAGMLSFYPSVRTAPLYRTRYLDNVASISTRLVSNPAFARRVRVVRSGATPAAMTVTFNDAVGNQLYQIDAAAGAQMSFEPISADVYSISVTFVFGGGGAIDARAIYELGL